MQRDSGIGGITIGPVSRSRGHGAANGHHGHGVVGSMGDMIIGNQVPSLLTNIFFVFYKYFPPSRPWTWMLSSCAASNSRSPPGSPLTAACAGLPWRIGKGEKIFLSAFKYFYRVDIFSSPVESDGSAPSQQLTPNRTLTDTEKLRKVITELIETERTYVKVPAERRSCK